MTGARAGSRAGDLRKVDEGRVGEAVKQNVDWTSRSRPNTDNILIILQSKAQQLLKATVESDKIGNRKVKT